jgi:hypothetical protein
MASRRSALGERLSSSATAQAALASCESDEAVEDVVEEYDSVPSTELGHVESESEFSDDDSDCSDVPFSPEDTILIFDWDDTVLPSTWIREQELRLGDDCIVTEEQQTRLKAMAQHATNTLRIAKRHGRVVLVTNAERGWIELSCQKFMPSLVPSLENVKLISARSTYEHQGVASPFEWKFLAFESEIGGFYEMLACEQKKKRPVFR